MYMGANAPRKQKKKNNSPKEIKYVNLRIFNLNIIVLICPYEKLACFRIR